MGEPWDRRTHPVTFQLHTESNLDRVELYCSSNNWTSSLARLTYAYKDSLSSQPAKYVFLHTLGLLPGDYEYRYKVNNRLPWVLNAEKKTRNGNNVLTKDDFIQLIVERCDLLERERVGETILEASDQCAANGRDNENTNVNYCNIGISLFKDPIFWDTELIINGTQHYKAHRAILSVHSAYFKTLFDQDNMTVPAEVQVEANDLSSFLIMLKFLYTGIIPSSLKHIQLTLLFQIATTYQIPTLIEIVQQNLVSTNVNINNCLLLLSMESKLEQNWLRVRELAIKIAAENFRYLCHQDGFLNLDYNIVQDILCHSNLRIPNTAMANMALNRWLNANKEITSDLSQSITTLRQYRHTLNRNSLVSSIVCYFADGSTHYTNMTINAINSFLRSTPEIMVGVLVKDDDTKDRIMSCIAKSYHHRILCKNISKTPHFNDWNPTQYKLDILTFLDHGFDEIYWMDSDTIVYNDLTRYLEGFRRSNKLFYFTLDHVMYDSSFVTKWRQQHQDTFIPQACFMGFKSSCMRTFFGLWKNAWKMWIEPKPFTMYQDPNPDFVGSSFCTEQYALGNAISDFIAHEAFSRNHVCNDQGFIFSFGRKLILIQTSERLESFYPSSKLRSMVRTNAYVSSQRYSFFLDTYLFKNSFYQISNFRTSAYLSKWHSMYHTSFSYGDVFIDSFFDCIFHFYNQNYQAGYEWYLTNFIQS